MSSFKDLINEGFEIKNDRVYTRYGGYTDFTISQFGFLKPIEYKIYGTSYSEDYRIAQDAYGDWCLYDGYSKVMELYYHGGKHWSSFR